jgi:hypothetical protein
MKGCSKVWKATSQYQWLRVLMKCSIDSQIDYMLYELFSRSEMINLPEALLRSRLWLLHTVRDVIHRL